MEYKVDEKEGDQKREDEEGKYKALMKSTLHPQEYGEYSQVKFVKLNQKTNGLITANDYGGLSILGYPVLRDPRFQVVENISTHHGPVNHICISPDNKLLFTAGQDGSIFIFNITEQIQSLRDGSLKPSIMIEDTQVDKKGQNKDPRLKIVDDNLADIVLVKKNEMVEWQ